MVQSGSRAKQVSLEGQVVPLEWRADHAVTRVGLLLLDNEEEIELLGRPMAQLEGLVDRFVRAQGRLMAGTRGSKVLQLESLEPLEEGPKAGLRHVLSPSEPKSEEER